MPHKPTTVSRASVIPIRKTADFLGVVGQDSNPDRFAAFRIGILTHDPNAFSNDYRGYDERLQPATGSFLDRPANISVWSMETFVQRRESAGSLFRLPRKALLL